MLERARVVEVLGSEVPQIGVTVHFLLLGVVALVMLATNLAIAMAVSPGMAALVLASILPMAGLAGLHLPRMHRLGEAVVADHQHLTEQTMRFLDGLKLATAQNLQADFVAGFRETSDAAVATRIVFLGLQATTQQAATTIAALVGLAIVAIGLFAWQIDAARLPLSAPCPHSRT